MYVDPKNFFKNYFNQNWKLKTDSMIKNQIIDFQNQKIEVFNKLKTFFDDLNKQIKEKNMAFAANIFNH